MPINGKLTTAGFEILRLVTIGLWALMFNAHVIGGLFAVETLLIGCGGKVVGDSAQSRSSSTGGSDGATHSGGGTSVQGDATGGSSVSITAVGGAAATGGLQPISEDQFYEVSRRSCGLASLVSIDAGAAATSCNVAHPQVPVPCGQGTMNAEFELMNVIFTKGDGSKYLVGYSSPDCAMGDGYYSDDANDTLVLCPKTCVAVQQDDSATIQIFAGCTVVPCIF
jgi:hypothetical protein